MVDDGPDNSNAPFHTEGLSIPFSTNLTWGTQVLTAVAKWPVDIAGGFKIQRRWSVCRTEAVLSKMYCTRERS